VYGEVTERTRGNVGEMERKEDRERGSERRRTMGRGEGGGGLCLTI